MSTNLNDHDRLGMENPTPLLSIRYDLNNLIVIYSNCIYLSVPTVVATSIWFQPESPRWLALRGEIDASRQALARLRPLHSDIEKELSEIIQTIDLERSRASKIRVWSTYLECFKRPNLHRTMLVIGVNVFLQATGQAFTSMYGPIIIKDIGSVNPFNYTLINNGLNVAMYLIVRTLKVILNDLMPYAKNILINDSAGRRPLMISSAAVQAICLFIIAGLGSTNEGTYLLAS